MMKGRGLFGEAKSVKTHSHQEDPRSCRESFGLGEEDVSTWKLPGDSCGAHESHRALTSSLPTIQEGKVRGFKRERRDDSALLVIRPCGCVASLLCSVCQGMQVQRAEDLEVSVSSS